jgi:hypothetical protein
LTPLYSNIPIFCRFKFWKPKQNSLTSFLEYNRGDYDKLRNDFNNIQWDECFESIINKYAENISTQIIRLSNKTYIYRPNTNAHNLGPPSTSTILEDLFLNAFEGKDILKSFKEDKASGPDGINNRSICESSRELSILKPIILTPLYPVVK